MLVSRSNSRMRRGGLYIIVAGAAMSVAIVGISALTVVRVQRRAAQGAVDMAEARAYAQCAIDMGLHTMKHTIGWRLTKPNGGWANKKPIGEGEYSLDAIDPNDGSFLNNSTDPVRLTGTGKKGQATYKMQVTLTSSTQPLAALKTAIHTAGQIIVRSGKQFKVYGAPVSTNGNIANNGTITGSVEALTVLPIGSISGTTTLLAPEKAMPDASVAATYAALGVAITPSTTIQKITLTPTSNPLGALSPDGVYVITSSANLTIRNVRILGTLVIIAPGKIVTIDQNVFIQNYRADYPALIVDGKLTLAFDGATQLDEAAQTTNFNPTGAPYLGVADTDQLDRYPSEIRGLVHVKSDLVITGAIRVRGGIICESTAGLLTYAVDVNANAEIVYDPSLFANPPKYYTDNTGTLVASSGSWQRVVSP